MPGASGPYLRALAAAGVQIIGTPDADVLEGTDADDEINGRAGDDTLYGYGGNDSLDGWAGADRMEGGAGDDVYFVDNAGDRVVEAAGKGDDLVRSGIDWTLGANVEDLRLFGKALTGLGNGLDNLLTGNGNGNRLEGGAGNDRLVGLNGDDQLFGGTGDDVFYGGAGGTVSLAYDADPVPDDGADMIYGETGKDTFVVPSWYGWDPEENWVISHGVVADLGAGIVDYTNRAFSRDLLFSIENMRTGDSDDTIRGSGKDNVIECGGGYNSVKALGGDDVIIGGTSSDYGGDGLRIMERLDGGAGDDVIDSNGSYWEYRVRYYLDFNFTTDRLFGRGGDDRLIGGTGHVVMTGGRGADIFEARSDSYEVYDYGLPHDVLASTVTITDFDPSDGDLIELRMGATSGDWEEEPTHAPIPTFVGRTSDLDLNEVGYSTLRRGDGSTDTIITHRYRFHNDSGWDDDGLTRVLDFRIVLEGYDGAISDGWIEFL